jgi:hypothetical protein
MEMSLENAFSTFLGALAGGLAASISVMLVERWREGRRLRNRHFEDIKSKCLKPILEELDKLKGYFMPGERECFGGSHDVERILKSDVRWWENFSFKRGDVEALLYEDLENHYPDLYKKLQNVEKLVRTEYVEYLRTALKLFKLIEDDPEFKAFVEAIRKEKEGVVNLIVSNTISYLKKAIFLQALGIDKSYWPNIYLYVKSELDRIPQSKFYNSVEAQKLRSIMQNMVIVIDGCIVKTGKIILEVKLKGRCKYLRG